MKYSKVLKDILILDKPAIISISGFGGSGKSTFANKLSRDIKASIIGIDSFCKSTNSKDFDYWEIMDYERLEHQVIIPFLDGENTITYGEFDWGKNEVLGTTTIDLKDYLIIEGVGMFRPELMKYFSYTIWIDCPIEIAIERGKRRDREEYGVQQDILWDGLWKKNDLQCYTKYTPLEKADFIMEYMG